VTCDVKQLCVIKPLSKYNCKVIISVYSKTKWHIFMAHGVEAKSMVHWSITDGNGETASSWK